jgi:hypothetical protein
VGPEGRKVNRDLDENLGPQFEHLHPYTILTTMAVSLESRLTCGDLEFDIVA